MQSPAFHIPGFTPVSRSSSSSARCPLNNSEKARQWSLLCDKGSSEGCRTPSAVRCPSEDPSIQPSTQFRTNMTTASTTDGWIYAVIESQGTVKDIGIALVNVSEGRCILAAFADTQMYGHLLHLLHVFEARLVLVSTPRNLAATGRQSKRTESVLEVTLKQETNVQVISLRSTAFDKEAGAEFIERLLLDECAAHSMHDDSGLDLSTLSSGQLRLHRGNLNDALSARGLVVRAAAAVFSYVGAESQSRLAPHSLVMHVYHPEGILAIDYSTSQELELVTNAISGKASGTLLDVVDYCSTAMGKQLLQMNILQPLTNPRDIQFRLDAIQCLREDSNSFMRLREILKELGSKKLNLNSTISSNLSSSSISLSAKERRAALKIDQKLSRVIAIWNALTSAVAVAEALQGVAAPLFEILISHLSSDRLAALKEHIDTVMNKDLLLGLAKSKLTSLNAKLFCINSGNNPLLDAARQTYQEDTADALDLCQSYLETFDLPFKVCPSSSCSGGYHLELPRRAIGPRDLPRQFIDISGSAKAKVYKLTTLDLKKCNQRMVDAASQILLLSDETVEDLCNDIALQTQALYRLSETLAFIDLIVSLTHHSLSGHYTRPTFGQSLVIEQGRHPLLDRRNPEGTVPNDTSLSLRHNFLLLTGPNNSGKTTYLKQVALLQIMARAGCFVPARKAAFPPLRQIIGRLRNTDEPDANLSAYANEIKKIMMIVETAQSDSLVLIDELGRNTSTHEGLGIAHAIAEVLIGKGAPTIMSTHFLQLVSTLSPYPAVMTRHFEVGVALDKSGMQMPNFAHRLVEECNESVGYGLAIARSSGLPSELINDASELSRRLRLNVNRDKSSDAKDAEHESSDDLYAPGMRSSKSNEHARYEHSSSLPDDLIGDDMSENLASPSLATEFRIDRNERLEA